MLSESFKQSIIGDTKSIYEILNESEYKLEEILEEDSDCYVIEEGIRFFKNSAKLKKWILKAEKKGKGKIHPKAEGDLTFLKQQIIPKMEKLESEFIRAKGSDKSAIKAEYKNIWSKYKKPISKGLVILSVLAGVGLGGLLYTFMGGSIGVGGFSTMGGVNAVKNTLSSAFNTVKGYAKDILPNSVNNLFGGDTTASQSLGMISQSQLNQIHTHAQNMVGSYAKEKLTGAGALANGGLKTAISGHIAPRYNLNPTNTVPSYLHNLFTPGYVAEIPAATTAASNATKTAGNALDVLNGNRNSGGGIW